MERIQETTDAERSGKGEIRKVKVMFGSSESTLSVFIDEKDNIARLKYEIFQMFTEEQKHILKGDFIKMVIISNGCRVTDHTIALQYLNVPDSCILAVYPKVIKSFCVL